MFIRLSLLAVIAFVPASAGQILITDFVSPTVETYTGLDALFGTDTADCGNKLCAATPLLIDGNTYNTSANDNHFLRYINASPDNVDCSGGVGSCLNTDSDLGFIDVTLGTPMQRVGAFANTFGTFTVDFFAPDNSLLGSVSANDSSLTFAGWQDTGGIARIRVTDTQQNQTSMLFDDLTFEGPVSKGTGGTTVPEPAYSALLSAAVLIVALSRRFPKSKSL
jgi:hypothetical protein